MALPTFSVESMITEDRLFCEQEIRKTHNTHAVDMVGNVDGDATGTFMTAEHILRRFL